MRLGVVGGGSLTDRIRELAEAEGASVTSGRAGDVLDADPEAAVAVGESALLALVREGLDVPVLPIDAGPGYGGVSSGDATDEASASDAPSSCNESSTSDPTSGDESATDGSIASEDSVPDEESAAVTAVETLLAGEFETDSRAVLGVSVGGERVGRALADAMLVTTEPARISEYAIHSDGERVERLRADGVVVSTPTGSHGYGRSAGGPLLEPGSGVVSVVPIAPFAVNVDHWILSAAEPISLSVERDEGEVSLLLDDRITRTVPPHTPVQVVADDAVDVVRASESRPFFER